MGDTNEYTVHDLVRDELYKNMDVEYGKFTASLSPGAGNIIGVRIPVLRKMAKEIASVNWKEYLDGARDDTFEEVMLQGIVLGYARGKIDDILTYMGRFIPKIDDWSICDTCCNTFKIANQYQQEVWDFLMPYLDEQGVIDGKPANERNREFELRFVAVMMLNHSSNILTYTLPLHCLECSFFLRCDTEGFLHLLDCFVKCEIIQMVII